MFCISDLRQESYTVLAKCSISGIKIKIWYDKSLLAAMSLEDYTNNHGDDDK